jgi:hypothetical protein
LSDYEACNTLESHGVVKKIPISTSSQHVKRKRSKVPLVMSEVKRSDRLKVKAMGFKTDACQTKTCFCCSIDPPTLYEKVIRSLGGGLCKMSPRVITEAALKKKVIAKKVVGSSKNQASKSSKQTKNKKNDKQAKKRRKE